VSSRWVPYRPPRNLLLLLFISIYTYIIYCFTTYRIVYQSVIPYFLSLSLSLSCWRVCRRKKKLFLF
jgi:hypothetical protein